MTTFTTLEGLKRRAKEMKSAEGCTHTEALDRIAKTGGYQNFTHARRELANG